ncbi:hypothetical protein GALL_447190 [mine drainage metagenome]|uniref:DNA-binding protein n=1 Tax=mine drainage metagenome TaxID=410659 RepID=A0A1J5PR63_9ZZZZ
MKSNASKIEQHAQSLHEDEVLGSCTRVEHLTDRKSATIVGTISSLIVRPSVGVRSLEAEVEDGTGHVVVVWLGRRRIVGVVPGADIEITGLMSRDVKGWRTFNPTYRLLSVSR